ncbi:CRISPR-associated endonuclease Cas2 [Actinomyces sp.]|uniref:CRISPR-associated endonuclease Cas2 n=1 Tax=Actinomyces sp. TaxID=29317 RepID=UPI0026DC11AB|nr:CRISPR-associated endonuclease Cas2 [Actinomyces sp.]MDO4900529.1 CRISPR-associated endonuclease Cas2 [Actinomyces sp.]
MIVILAYDVSADSRRTRLAAVLESWGLRIQESVFQRQLEEEEFDEARERFKDIIDSRDDVVHIFPLRTNCLGRAEVHGTAPALDDGGLNRGAW